VTFKEALRNARETLTAQNIEDAPLECELLLRHTLQISRAELYSDLNRKLTPKQEETFWALIKRRLRHEPTAYITNNREFYALSFYVDPRVLIPRPESELLIDEALKLAQNHTLTTVADIGTGCGAIAISLALNLPEVKIYATDISASALEVARLNLKRHRVNDRIELLLGDLLQPLPKSVDLVIANLPYVKKSELPQISHEDSEPLLALDGGPDGLKKIRELSLELEDKLSPKGNLLLEIGFKQAEKITSLLKNRFRQAEIEVIPDLSGIDRVIKLSLTPKEAK